MYHCWLKIVTLRNCRVINYNPDFRAANAIKMNATPYNTRLIIIIIAMYLKVFFS